MAQAVHLDRRGHVGPLAQGDDAIRRAKGFDGPWAHGTCYDAYSQDSNETGPLSGPLAGVAFDERLPLSSGPTLHEVNCNVIAAHGG